MADWCRSRGKHRVQEGQHQDRSACSPGLSVCSSSHKGRLRQAHYAPGTPHHAPRYYPSLVAQARARNEGSPEPDDDDQPPVSPHARIGNFWTNPSLHFTEQGHATATEDSILSTAQKRQQMFEAQQRNLLASLFNEQNSSSSSSSSSSNAGDSNWDPGSHQRRVVQLQLEALLQLMGRYHKARVTARRPNEQDPNLFVLPDVLHMLLQGVPLTNPPATAADATAVTPLTPTQQNTAPHSVTSEGPQTKATGKSPASNSDVPDMDSHVAYARLVLQFRVKGTLHSAMPGASSHASGPSADLPRHSWPVFEPMFKLAVQTAQTLMAKPDTVRTRSRAATLSAEFRSKRMGPLNHLAQSMLQEGSGWHPGSNSTAAGESAAARAAAVRKQQGRAAAGTEDSPTQALIHNTMYKLLRVALHSPLRHGVTLSECDPGLSIVAWAVSLATAAIAMHVTSVDLESAVSSDATFAVLRDIAAGAGRLAAFERQQPGTPAAAAGWGKVLQVHALSQLLHLMMRRQSVVAQSGKPATRLRRQAMGVASNLQEVLCSITEVSDPSRLSTIRMGVRAAAAAASQGTADTSSESTGKTVSATTSSRPEPDSESASKAAASVDAPEHAESAAHSHSGQPAELASHPSESVPHSSESASHSSESASHSSESADHPSKPAVKPAGSASQAQQDERPAGHQVMSTTEPSPISSHATSGTSGAAGLSTGPSRPATNSRSKAAAWPSFAMRHSLVLADAWQRLGDWWAASVQHASALQCYTHALTAYEMFDRATCDNHQEFHVGRDHESFAAMALDARGVGHASSVDASVVSNTVWLHRQQIQCASSLIDSYTHAEASRLSALAKSLLHDEQASASYTSTTSTPSSGTHNNDTSSNSSTFNATSGSSTFNATSGSSTINATSGSSSSSNTAHKDEAQDAAHTSSGVTPVGAASALQREANRSAADRAALSEQQRVSLRLLRPLLDLQNQPRAGKVNALVAAFCAWQDQKLVSASAGREASISRPPRKTTSSAGTTAMSADALSDTVSSEVQGSTPATGRDTSSVGDNQEAAQLTGSAVPATGHSDADVNQQLLDMQQQQSLLMAAKAVLDGQSGWVDVGTSTDGRRVWDLTPLHRACLTILQASCVLESTWRLAAVRASMLQSSSSALRRRARTTRGAMKATTQEPIARVCSPSPPSAPLQTPVAAFHTAEQLVSADGPVPLQTHAAAPPSDKQTKEQLAPADKGVRADASPNRTGPAATATTTMQPVAAAVHATQSTAPATIQLPVQATAAAADGQGVAGPLADFMCVNDVSVLSPLLVQPYRSYFNQSQAVAASFKKQFAVRCGIFKRALSAVGAEAAAWSLHHHPPPQPPTHSQPSVAQHAPNAAGLNSSTSGGVGSVTASHTSHITSSIQHQPGSPQPQRPKSPPARNTQENRQFSAALLPKEASSPWQQQLSEAAGQQPATCWTELVSHGEQLLQFWQQRPVGVVSELRQQAWLVLAAAVQEQGPVSGTSSIPLMRPNWPPHFQRARSSRSRTRSRSPSPGLLSAHTGTRPPTGAASEMASHRSPPMLWGSTWYSDDEDEVHLGPLLPPYMSQAPYMPFQSMEDASQAGSEPSSQATSPNPFKPTISVSPGASAARSTPTPSRATSSRKTSGSNGASGASNATGHTGRAGAAAAAAAVGGGGSPASLMQLSGMLPPCAAARGVPLRLQALHEHAVQLTGPNSPLNLTSASLVGLSFSLTPWHATVIASLVQRKGNLDGLLAEQQRVASARSATRSSSKAAVSGDANADAAVHNVHVRNVSSTTINTERGSSPQAVFMGTGSSSNSSSSSSAATARQQLLAHQQLVSGVLTAALQRKLMQGVLSGSIKPTVLKPLMQMPMLPELKLQGVLWLAKRDSPSALWLAMVGLRDLVSRHPRSATSQGKLSSTAQVSHSTSMATSSTTASLTTTVLQEVDRSAGHANNGSGKGVAWSSIERPASTGSAAATAARVLMARPTSAHLMLACRAIVNAALQRDNKHAATALACATALAQPLVHDSHDPTGPAMEFWKAFVAALFSAGPHPYLLKDLATALISAGNPAALPVSVVLCRHLADTSIDHCMDLLFEHILQEAGQPPAAATGIQPMHKPAASNGIPTGTKGTAVAPIAVAAVSAQPPAGLSSSAASAVGSAAASGTSSMWTPTAGAATAAAQEFLDLLLEVLARDCIGDAAGSMHPSRMALPGVVAVKPPQFPPGDDARVWLARRVAHYMREASKRGVSQLSPSMLDALVQGLSGSKHITQPSGGTAAASLDGAFPTQHPAIKQFAASGYDRLRSQLERSWKSPVDILVQGCGTQLQACILERICSDPRYHHLALSTLSGIIAAAGEPVPQPATPASLLLCKVRHGLAALALLKEIGKQEIDWTGPMPSLLVEMHRVHQNAVKGVQSSSSNGAQIGSAQGAQSKESSQQPNAVLHNSKHHRGKRGSPGDMDDAKSRQLLLAGLPPSAMAKVILSYALLGHTSCTLQEFTAIKSVGAAATAKEHKANIGALLSADGALLPPLPPRMMADQALKLVNVYFIMPTDTLQGPASHPILPPTTNSSHSYSGASRNSDVSSSISSMGPCFQVTSDGKVLEESNALVPHGGVPHHAPRAPAADALYDLLEEVLKNRLDTAPSLAALLHLVCRAAISVACASQVPDRTLLVKALLAAQASEQLPHIRRSLQPYEILRVAAVALQLEQYSAALLLLKHLAGLHGLRSSAMAPHYAEFINSVAFTLSSQPGSIDVTSDTSQPAATAAAAAGSAGNSWRVGTAGMRRLGGCERYIIGILTQLSRETSMDVSRALTAAAKRMAIGMCVEWARNKTALKLWAAWQARHSMLDVGRSAACWLLVACADVGEWQVGQQLLQRLGPDVLLSHLMGPSSSSTAPPRAGLMGSSVPAWTDYPLSVRSSNNSSNVLSRVFGAYLRILAAIPSPVTLSRSGAAHSAQVAVASNSGSNTKKKSKSAGSGRSALTEPSNDLMLKTTTYQSKQVAASASSSAQQVPVLPFVPLEQVDFYRPDNLSMLDNLVRGEAVLSNPQLPGAYVVSGLERLVALLTAEAGQTDWTDDIGRKGKRGRKAGAQQAASMKSKRGRPSNKLRAATMHSSRDSASLYPRAFLILEFLLQQLQVQDPLWVAQHAGQLHDVCKQLKASLISASSQFKAADCDIERALAKLDRLTPAPYVASTRSQALPASSSAKNVVLTNRRQANMLPTPGRSVAEQLAPALRKRRASVHRD